METLGPSLIALAAGVAVLVAWSRWRRDDRMGPVLERAAERMSQHAADELVKSLTRWGVARYVGLAIILVGSGLAAPRAAQWVSNLGPGPGPGGGGVLAIFRRGGGTTPSGSVGAPNTPTGVTAVVIDTSNVYLMSNAFVGSGADTQDSVNVQLFRVANDMSGAAMLDLKQGAFVRDTFASNDSLKADTTYKARMRHKGTAGGWSAWSAPDTFVNTVVAVEVFFHSDWSTGTGSGDAAVLDQGQDEPWTDTYIANPEVKATSGSGLNFPTTNFLSIHDDANGVQFYRSDGYYSDVATGDSIFLRFYVANTNTGASGESHGIYFDDEQATPNWPAQTVGISVRNVTSGNITWTIATGCGSGCVDFWSASTPTNSRIVKDVVYRQEIGIWPLSATTYRVQARIYDDAGALLDSTWAGQDAYNGQFLSPQTLTSTSGHAQSLSGIRFGLEASQGGSTDYMGIAGVAICHSWCGPYPIAGVEN